MTQLLDMSSDFRISKVRRDSTQKKQESHIHPYYEIFYLINGDCTFFSGHNIYRLNQGDLVIIPKGELHRSTYPEKGYSERFFLCLKEPYLKWMQQVLGEEITGKSLEAGVISIPENCRGYLEGLMEKMLAESEGWDLLSPAFVKTELLEMILFIIRCQRFEQNVIKERDIDSRLIQEVAAYISEHYETRLSLNELARQFHISRSYLSKKFHESTGFGLKEYMINVRIQNACRLLMETNRSVTEIALECGFNDSNYFGDAFRKVKGMSPSKYRKNREMV